MFLVFLGLTLIGLMVAMVFALQGAPFVRTTTADVEQIAKLVDGYQPRRILDMGSGDGTVVLALAHQGYLVDGIELNPRLVWKSRQAIKRAGLSDLAKIYHGSFWKFDVSSYDLIVLYGATHIMGRLETKLLAELPSKAKIISNFFEFPHAKPVKTLQRFRIYIV